jgi:putative spermidine/putrescine transport system permease protein
MSEPLSRTDRLRIGAFYVFCALVFGYLVLPSVIVIPLSFNSEPFLIFPIKAFSLRWYDEFFENIKWLPAIYHSTLIACGATFVATVLGTLAALGLDRLPWGPRQLARSVFLLPIIVPVVVTGSSIYLLFAPLGLTSTFAGVIIGHTVLAAPFVVIVVLATLQGVDRNLMRAAQILGAAPATVFRRITLPLILPGVISGAVFAFAVSFDEIVLTLLIAGPAQRTLPLQMLSGIKENLRPTVTAAATILVLISLILLTIVEVLRRTTQASGIRGNDPGHLPKQNRPW